MSASPPPPGRLDGLRILISAASSRGRCPRRCLPTWGRGHQGRPPGGDDYRHIGPMRDGISSLFTALNRK